MHRMPVFLLYKSVKQKTIMIMILSNCIAYISYVQRTCCVTIRFSKEAEAQERLTRISLSKQYTYRITITPAT